MKQTVQNSPEKKPTLYTRLEGRFPRFAPCIHLILFFIALVALDFGFRAFFSHLSILSDAQRARFYPFTLGWALAFTGIAALLPRKARQIYMIALTTVFALLCVTHSVFINMFRRFFSVTDFAFAGDGAAFADLSYLVVRKLLLAVLILCVLISVLAALLTPRPRKDWRRWVKACVMIALGAAVILFTRFKILGHTNANLEWSDASNPAFLYEDFTNTPACLTFLGLYQYTFRDIQHAIPQHSTLTREERAFIDQYAAGRTHEDNEMTGVLAGKNLMLIQLECIDTWMTEYMPALQEVKANSVVFENHYAPRYLTAGTFNTELMVNLGLLPSFGGTTSAVYCTNSFPYSLANLFRNAGYTANSYHRSNASIYNRGSAHKNWGYEAYHSGAEMGLSNLDLDSTLVEAFDQMVSGDPFFSFVITYSGHGPYSAENEIFLAHSEQAYAQAKRSEGSYVYAVGHAMETDAFIAALMERMEETGLLDNTVLVFYADHYNYYMLDDDLVMDIKGVDSYNELQHTDFFIYSKDLEPQTVEKYTSSIDVFPTLTNLFALDAPYGLLAGSDAFSDEGGYVFFSDNSWLGTEEDMAEEILLRRKVNALLLKGNYWAG